MLAVAGWVLCAKHTAQTNVHQLNDNIKLNQLNDIK